MFHARRHRLGYIIQLDPTEGCSLRGVKIKVQWHSGLSLLIFTKSVGSMPRCATASLLWHSGSGNILEFPWHCHGNLDDLVKLAKHLDAFFPAFKKNFQFFFFSFGHPPSLSLFAPQASFRPVLSFPLLSFVQMRSFFPLLQSVRSSKSTPSSPPPSEN